MLQCAVTIAATMVVYTAHIFAAELAHVMEQLLSQEAVSVLQIQLSLSERLPLESMLTLSVKVVYWPAGHVYASLVADTEGLCAFHRTVCTVQTACIMAKPGHPIIS